MFFFPQCTGMTTVAHTKPPHEYDILAFNYDPHVVSPIIII